MKLKNFNFTQKLIYHPEHLVKLHNGERPFPITAEVDLTNLCNHNCSFCMVHDFIRSNLNTLEKDKIEKTILEMRKLGLKGISFTGGGEPLVHPDCVDIVEYTKSLGISTGMMTNGALITEKKAKRLANNLDWIRVSVSAGKSDTYSKIQGKDDYEKVIHNIGILAAQKKSSKINIGVRMLVSNENIHTLCSLANDIKDFNVDYLQIAPDASGDDYNFKNIQGHEEVFDKCEQILKANQIDFLIAGFPIGQEQRNVPQKCYGHFYQIAITADGNVSFCKNVRGNKDFVLGNINESSIEEIWNSDRTLELEAELKPSNCSEVCKNMMIHLAIEDFLHPDQNNSPNFVG